MRHGSQLYPRLPFQRGMPYVPPYSTFDTISLFGDVGKTNYDSLQIKAETKTLKYGLYALFAYTYSHT